ncbi:isoprenylcysteine carboxylmethyltransferase family protein [Acidimicrobiaceae bacterium]|nr:isoprenylcysteine carboxylmethyltransferase family protein [Acidimicrobiaceae bacterium]
MILLIALVLLPGANHWPTPGWLQAVASVLVFGGFALMGIAALGLGRSLTPTPVPVSYGELQTGGMYRWMRHPIYTGVLMLVAGLAMRSGKLVHLVIAVGTFAFFDRKARWEEARLAEKYSGYSDYAQQTPRFIPRSQRRN